MPSLTPPNKCDCACKMHKNTFCSKIVHQDNCVLKDAPLEETIENIKLFCKCTSCLCKCSKPDHLKPIALVPPFSKKKPLVKVNTSPRRSPRLNAPSPSRIELPSNSISPIQNANATPSTSRRNAFPTSGRLYRPSHRPNFQTDSRSSSIWYLDDEED